jgi:hypothetical protein
MDSTVKTRPNHYELLGLVPSASEEEIAGAFAKAMGQFRPMAETAQMGLAYEVLRDPARRRAYDDSLGLRPEPKPIHAPAAVTFRGSAHFIASSVVETQPRLEARREAQPEAMAEPEVVPEQEPESLVAATLRSSDALHVAPPRPRRPEPIAKAEIADTEEGFDWQRPVVAIGGVVLAVAAIGAWAGVKAGNDAAAEAPDQAVTLSVPRAAPAVAAVPEAVQAEPQRQARAHAVRRTPGRATPAVTQAADPAPSEATAADPLAPEPSIDSAASPSLPLSHAAIAQTIGRIGYACGRVASTTAIEGGGAFKVTCTSGNSYRAAPVRGRYRFKRL